MKKLHGFVCLATVLLACLNFASAQAISPKEFLTVEIRGIPQGEQARVTGRYMVTPDGQLFLPMIKGGIQASGIDSAKLSRRIEAAYKDAGIYQDPRITVVSQKNEGEGGIDAAEVSVTGRVNRNGPVAFKRDMTLLKAIAAAGGVDMFGTIKRVELHRGNKKTIYDLRKDESKRVKVQEGDLIVVPQKGPFDGQ
ncbi:polysaccharide biosynthesis/export family protein [Verrucomicrobiaceae bacterium N1E253]|uniref:Polysaccharide biosynthesis/export family protein n=1 Tax=Oceaniferula marina TaxID=2748318 RepID=A0A851GI38_9BACT|nr:polysaccharide biosynthesis/export family protein [Oceaniferula marina]NWK57448.1 polysaccharide biosynthesis/export family protein [Oceaniferula marina]